eukprot:tig00000806_g4332.t1
MSNGRFKARFSWHQRDITMTGDTEEEATRIRDRLAIICRFVDKKAGWEPLRHSIRHYPLSEYTEEKFYVALNENKLELPEDLSVDEDYRDKVLAFFKRYHSNSPSQEPTTKETIDLDVDETIEGAERAREDEEDEYEDDSDEGDGGSGDESSTKSDHEDDLSSDNEEEELEPRARRPSTLRGRRRKTTSTSGFHGVTRKKGSWRGSFLWREHSFCVQTATAEETARFRDRAIICCQRVDREAGIPESDCVSDDKLNFDRSEYEKEQFYADLGAGKLEERLKRESATDEGRRAAIREFIRDCLQVQLDSESGDRDGSGRVEKGCGYKGMRVMIRKRTRSSSGYFNWRGKHFTTPVSNTLENSTRLRDRFIITCMRVDKAQGFTSKLTEQSLNFPESDYKKENFFEALQRAAFLANLPKSKDPVVLFPIVRKFLADMGAAPAPMNHDDREDAAGADRDRDDDVDQPGPRPEKPPAKKQRIERPAARLDPEPEAAAGPEISMHAPMATTTTTAPMAGCTRAPAPVPVGALDPSVSLHLEAPATATTAPPEASAQPGPAPGLPSSAAAPSAGGFESAAAGEVAPATPAALALNPVAGLVLKWGPEETMAWLAGRFALRADGLVYRVLHRLALTGPVLVLRPECFLRRRLLETLKDEIPNAGKREEDALKTVLDSLDVMVEMLVEEAKEGAPDERARREIDMLFARRAKEISAAAAGAAPR